MRILGIDPGSRVTGYGVVDFSDPHRPRRVTSGCLRLSVTDLPARLLEIHDRLAVIIAETVPAVCAIERVFLARNPDSALKLGQARAAAILAAVRHGLPVSEYAANEIKLAVVGVGHADKHQVGHMVGVLLTHAATLAADESDALACALCHGFHAAAHNAGVRPRTRSRGRGLRFAALPVPPGQVA